MLNFWINDRVKFSFKECFSTGIAKDYYAVVHSLIYGTKTASSYVDRGIYKKNFKSLLGGSEVAFLLLNPSLWVWISFLTL